MHDGAPAMINGRNRNLKECPVCTSTLRTRYAGDALETYCPYCEREMLKERARQQEHEEQALGHAPRQTMRRGKTAKDRTATQRFENDLRAQPNHSVFVTGIYKPTPDDTYHAGIRVEITVSRTYVEKAPWLPDQEHVRISAIATHPKLQVFIAEYVRRPAISKAASPSLRSIHRLLKIKAASPSLHGIRRLLKIGESVAFTFVDMAKMAHYLSCTLTRTPELLWFLRVHGIIPLRRVNRTKGRLSAKERRHIEAEHAHPTSELHPCRLRRENRSGRRGHEYGVTVKNNDPLFRKARAQQKDWDMQSSFSPNAWIGRHKEALLSPSSDNEVERCTGKYGEPLPQSTKPNRATRAREALAARARRYN